MTKLRSTRGLGLDALRFRRLSIATPHRFDPPLEAPHRIAVDASAYGGDAGDIRLVR